MEIAALLTSAGINISICIVLLSLYSVLRKQPANYCVYFGRRLVCGGARRYDPFWYERFVPSPSWLVKAWETSEDELLTAAGLDAVVFLRMVIFSIRIFFITAVVCIAFVLPVNYYGQPRMHKEIHLESSEVFTIENLKEGSKWLWVHCLALYIITSAACLLLYFEYRTIAKMRLGHITSSAPKPSQFTVLIRAIPWHPEQSYSDTLSKYFINYYSSSYLSHQMVYHNGIIQRLLILNVYITKYESGGKYWPIFHNTTIFSLILTQIIALGFFGLKLSTVASGFTIPLILLTLLFSEYCRHRFAPIFHKHPAQVLIDMDRADEMTGRMEELHKKLHSVYSQIPLHLQKSSSNGESSTPFSNLELPDPEKLKPEEGDAIAKELWGFHLCRRLE